MKKLILSVSLVLIGFNGYAQTGSLNSGSGAFDSSNNPSGVGFGGAMGGANTPSGNTSDPGPGSSTGTSTVPGSALPQKQQEAYPRGIEEQQERGNFTGGSLSGQPSNSTVAPTNPSAVPADTAAPPTRPTTIPSPTGPGTGSPTSY